MSSRPRELAAAVFVLLVPACTQVDPASSVPVRIVDHTTDDINRYHADWKRLMQRAVADLNAAGETTVADELSTMVENADSNLAVEGRASVDFIALRMLDGLARAKAELTGQPVPARTPYLSNVVPHVIDLNLADERHQCLTYYGWDLKEKGPSGDGLRLFLIENDAVSLDVTDKLASSAWNGTVNLSDDGVPLTEHGSKLLFQCSGESREVNIIQRREPTPYVLEVPGVSFGPFVPPHRRFVWTPELPGDIPDPIGDSLQIRHMGDWEFDGNGPKVHVKAKLKINDGNLQVRLFMSAAEWDSGDGRPKDDYTFARGWSEWYTVRNRDPEITILDIMSDDSSEVTYIDTNQQDDLFRFPDDELVHEFVCVGDTGKSDDAGVRTSVSVRLNPVKVLVITGIRKH